MHNNIQDDQQQQIAKLNDELQQVRNELAMTKQDLMKSQVAVGTAVNLLRTVGGQIVKINLLQSEAQGITAELIKGIEKVLAMIPQQQQQQQQQQGQ